MALHYDSVESATGSREVLPTTSICRALDFCPRILARNGILTKDFPKVNSLSMNFDAVSAACLRKPILRQDFARVSFAKAKRAHRKAHENHENAESGREGGYD